MKDADFSFNEHPKPRAKNEPERRGRVGKTSPSSRAGGGRGGKQQGGGDDRPGGWKMKADMTSMVSRKRASDRRSSILSAASNAGPWCDKCASLNRQLHGYLLEILKDGEAAVGDWAFAVGASPDHMECEPAPERIIPEGYHRCSLQRHLCASGTQGEAGTVVPPPLTAGWPGTAFTSNIYPVQSGQAPAGASPYSQLGSKLDLTRRTLELTPAPAGGTLQTGHALVAIPERAESYAQRAGQPSQAQLPAPQPLQPPWNGGFQRPAAMYPNSGTKPGTTYSWASQQRHVQPVAAVHSPTLSLAHNGAMRGIGQGKMFRVEQALPDSDIPE